MKSIYLQLLFCVCLLTTKMFAQSEQKTQAIVWQNFSTSSNVLGVINPFSKPLQYNNELDLISFIQRRSSYYPLSPGINPAAATGVITANLSSNWGATWDSTCLWSNSIYSGRYPQGGVYNPPSNTSLSNAYVVGIGPCLDTLPWWAGNWAASKQIGPGTYNTSVSAVPGAQQMFSSNAPYASFGKCGFASNSFSSCDNGKLHALAQLAKLGDPGGSKGAMILNATFNSGVFSWSGDSILCPAAYNSYFEKALSREPVMSWNEDGTVGYLIFIGAQYGGTGSNTGLQPIVFRTTNSGISWQLMPCMDFNAPEAQNLKKFLPKADSHTGNPNIVIPNVASHEGWDAVVDKNNTLHIACLLNGAIHPSPDSLFYFRRYGTEFYNWKHAPGRRPYLVDFMLFQTQQWQYGIIDSLSSESPGSVPNAPGYNYNPWGLQNITNMSRIQCSRTPEGRFVLVTWAESDTTLTPSGVKWNTHPDIKARLIDANNYGLSSSELNLSAGTNTNVSARATMHFVSPRSGTATVSASAFDVVLPVTITNNSTMSSNIDCSHWFSAVPLHFSNATSPFTYSISGVSGLEETNHPEKLSGLVYPNPFGSGLHVSTPLSGRSNRIELFSVYGNKLLSINSNEPELELNTAQLASGTYLLIISSETDTFKKIIVKE